jgi:hypothetical protein
MDEKISDLFQQWLSVFEAEQLASSDEVRWREDELREIENRLAATPADGLKGLTIKLALHCFLQNQEDTSSSQADSAYWDLVRLTGNDPLVDINARFKKSAREM